MKNALAILVSVSSLLVTPSAGAAPAHAHGKAGLEVVIEGGRVSLALESPLDSLVGFERAPRNAAETASVKAAAALLRAADKQFIFTPEASCTLVSAKLVSAAIAPSLLGESTGDAKGAHPAAASEHADLDGEFVFQCVKPAALKSLDVRLFKSFKGLHELKLQLVAPNKQKAARLTSKSTSLRW